VFPDFDVSLCDGMTVNESDMMDAHIPQKETQTTGFKVKSKEGENRMSDKRRPILLQKGFKRDHLTTIPL